jgi:pimeloyl-ACP methyl ester carboxylesterase
MWIGGFAAAARVSPTRCGLAVVLAAMAAMAGCVYGDAAAASGIPPAECQTHVGYDRDLDLPGYLISTKQGARVCVPFTATAVRPPPGYSGDFYVDEFTDAKVKERWEACKKDTACFERLSRHIARRKPPNREHGITDPRAIYLLGKIDADNLSVDLKTIRRPAFFAEAPYRESIAAAEPRTFTVEFTAPPEPYERVKLNMTAAIKLRGWYLQGRGVADGKGHMVRSLVIMSNGGGGRLVAIEDPSDHLYHMDSTTGRSVLNSFPNATTGASGQRGWRRYLYMLNTAGFDVLSYDRRGVGLSGGFSDTNTLQQGRDILGVIAELSSGEGIRVLTPAGAELQGKAAATALLAGAQSETMPILLGGSSRGTMATGWAMTRNFAETCDYDLAVAVDCGPPVGIRNIKGALMLADYSAGLGYLTAPTDAEDEDRGLFLAGTEAEYGIVFFPASQPLAGIRKWPALFIGRGLWDYAESLEGAIAAYERVRGPKELVVVRGPHPFETWPAEEQERVGQRMVQFARAVALGYKSAPGGRGWSNMKELVATASDVWEPSSQPKGH